MRTQLKNRNVDKTLARLLAVLLTVVLALSSLPGCMLFEAGNGPAGPWANNHGQGIVQPDDPDPDPDPDHQPRALDALADDLLDFELAADYTSYHQLVARPADYRFGAGFAAPLPSFGDISYEAMLAQADFYTELLAEVRQHNPARLDPDQLRLYQYLSYSLESSLALVPYFYLEDPYEPSSGTHSDLALTLLTFQFRTTADIDDYLTLAADIPRILKQADDIAVQRSSDGFYPNLTAVESAIEEAEVYAAPPDSNILVASFEDSLASGVYPFSGLSDDQRAGYAAANREIVEQQLIPAYQQTIALLEDIATHTDYQTTLPKLPGAKDYYAAAMRTLGFYESPDQAIARLDEQLDELNDRVISGAGYLDSVKQDRVAERNLPGDAASIIEYYNSCVSEHFPDIGQRPFRVDTA
ncbi:MAG: DUF885 family protein, partial [Coriobacteriia bacterium]|nr:DUF885 family protein [Coriobacteriia bacterium]